MAEKLNKETKNRSRLSIHNEELQWKLKQNSERHQKTLQELSKSYQDRSFFSMSMSQRTESSEEGTVSPPASPKVKGIVETSDAVSYILEMDDESPGQVASRAIRRVGSFRASPTNALKRSKSSSQSPMTGNPLSQSASATSISRQFSAETSPMRNGGAGCNSAVGGDLGRIRSKSMSVNKTPVVRRSLGSVKLMSKELDGSFQTPPIHASSPYKENGHENERQIKCKPAVNRSSAIKNLSFARGPSGKSSVVVQQEDVLPQESAGEAMILHISDGEDCGLLSQNSSLTASTTSTSSDEEVTAEKNRTAISIHHQQQRGEDGEEDQVVGDVMYTSRSLTNNSSCRNGNGIEEEMHQQKWSPSRLLGHVAMEECEEEDGDEEGNDDVFGNHSESVV